ncbi:MAG: glycosyltransferase family 4 protein [Solirubrobacterales bacterium]
MELVQTYLVAIGLPFLLALTLVPASMRVAAWVGAVDKPNARKMHVKPMPRLGGLGIFVAFMAVVLVAPFVPLKQPLIGILIGGGLIFALGVLDDVFRLNAWTKLAAQIVAALVTVHFGVKVQFLSVPFDGMVDLGMMSIPLTVLWIIGVTNAVNLIDGLDGLAGGVSGIAALTVGVVALLAGQHAVAFVAFCLVGAVAGFLPYNYHPAKTFMGDSGALFLGFTLSCLSIAGLAKSAALISLFVPVVILAIPIFDTLFAIVRRVNNRQPIFKPDKEHLHHQLIAMGFSHKRTVLIIYGFNAMLGIVAVWLTYLTSPQAMLLLGLLAIVIIIGARWLGVAAGREPDAQAESCVASEPDRISEGV